MRFVLQHGVPIVELHPQRQRVARDRGVVHEDIEPAEFRERLLETVFHLRGVGHVHRDGQRFAPGGRDFPGERGELIGAACRQHNLGARLGQRQRCGAADALRRAGNESDFIFERKHELDSYVSATSARACAILSSDARKLAASSTLKQRTERSIWRSSPKRTLPGPTSTKKFAP